MSPRLAFAIETAIEAGKSTLGLFRAGRDYELKDNRTPVTEADLNAERMIREAVSRAFPRDAILGEEEGGDAGSEDRWVVDPIDGTKSFICGVPLYATLLAYEVSRVPVLGVCYFPALDEILYAELAQGAYWNRRPCRVRAVSDVQHAVVSCGGLPAMERLGRLEGFLNLSRGCLASRTWCDAYGHALVASGRIDAMVDPVVSRWDISAMAVIVREAGGSFTDFDGGEDFAEEAVSCTPALKEVVLGAFRS